MNKTDHFGYGDSEYKSENLNSPGPEPGITRDW